MTTENMPEWQRLRAKFGTSDRPFRIADRLLKEMDIDRPHVKLYDITKKLGVKIIMVPDLGWYGQIQVTNQSAAIIWVKKEDTIERKRFTIAHELGHLFLHDVCRVEYYRDKTFSGTPEETQANQFAANLLMPQWMIEEYMCGTTNDDIKQLSSAFRVSEIAMGFQLKNICTNGD